MKPTFSFRCINPECGSEWDAGLKLYQCPLCADLLDLVYALESVDPDDMKRLFRQRRSSNLPLDISGVWRFREFLPFTVQDHSLALTLGEGNSPLLAAPASARHAGLRHLWVKHLGWNPTGSFKDYGMTVAATQARKLGCRFVACASTGNTSASMAAYCARSQRLQAVVFVPEGQIAYGKLSQTLDYGALTVQIEGDFDGAMRLVRELSQETDLYLMNSINPFRLEGQKMAVFELLDQLDWNVPDRIVVPGGNLGNSSALGKALSELHDWGFIDKLPRLTVIQAAGAAPLQRMLATGAREMRPVADASTRATAIKIGSPVSWKKAVRAIDLTDGWCDSVTEQEIADAKAVLGSDGIGCEPASATTVAGLRKFNLQGGAEVDPGETVVALLTGHQLKDSEYTVQYHLGELFAGRDGSGKVVSTFGNRPIRVAADKRAVLRLLEERIHSQAD